MFFGASFFGGGFFGLLAAGSSARRRPLFIARHKGEEYYFSTDGELEQFVKEARAEIQAETVGQSAKAKKRALKRLTVKVEPEFQDELYSYDLPAIQPMLDRQGFEEVQRLLARFEVLKAARFDDDEEALILLL